MLGWLFAIAQAGTLLWLLFRGWHRRAPLFLGMLALSAWQAVASVFAPLYSRAWWASTWLPVERWHVAFAILATIEVLCRQTACLESTERKGLRRGIPLLTLCFAWYLWPSKAATPYDTFLRDREICWSACAFAMCCLMIFGMLKSVPGTAHRWLFGLWMLAHAGIAPLLQVVDTQWFNDRTAYRVIVIALCVGWTLVAAVPAPLDSIRKARHAQGSTTSFRP